MVRSGFTRFAAGLACLWALTVAPALAQVPTETEVDLALVVAVDISFSMDTDEASRRPSAPSWSTTPSAAVCWAGSP